MGNLKALGTRVEHSEKYDPSQLEGFSRDDRRSGFVRMFGVDVWTCFEVSFLKKNGLPYFMVLRISNPSDSKKIFESKSLKLYLNSFNNTVFSSRQEVIQIIKKDLSELVEGNVLVESVVKFQNENSFYYNANKIEDYVKNIEISEYSYNPKLLEPKPVSKGRTEPIELYSDLLRSNCEITGAPDWAKVSIVYQPNEVEVTYESLLKYLVSMRTHQMFHEPTTEVIFQDLVKFLKPKSLTVICQYTRRGGIDINPIRSTEDKFMRNKIINLPKTLQQ